jgi:hypothetical protein
LRKIGLETVIERDFNWVHELERDMMEERGTGEAMNLRERSLEEKEEEEIAERKRGVIVVEDERRMIER